MLKRWSKKKKFIIACTAVMGLFLLFLTTVVIKQSFQCGEFDLALMDMSSKSRTCMTPPHDTVAIREGMEYLDKSYASTLSYGDLLSGAYTLQIATEWGPMNQEEGPFPVQPQYATLFVEIRQAVIRPLNQVELAFVDSGMRACDRPVYAQSGLKLGQYHYQIRMDKLIYTITYDNRKNSYIEKGRGQEILQTLLDTMKCKDEVYSPQP